MLADMHAPITSTVIIGRKLRHFIIWPVYQFLIVSFELLLQLQRIRNNFKFIHLRVFIRQSERCSGAKVFYRVLIFNCFLCH